MAYVFRPNNSEYEFDFDDSFEFQGDHFGLISSGEPLSKEHMPSKIVICKGRGSMPDIFDVHYGYTVVSEELKLTLERLAPSDASFLEIPFNIVSTLKRSRRYFFFNVLGRAQATCWEKTKVEEYIIPEKHRLAGAKPLHNKRIFWLPASVTNSPNREGWYMKRRDSADPALWKEIDLETSDRIFQGQPGDKYMTNMLYEALGQRIQRQLFARPIKEIDC